MQVGYRSSLKSSQSITDLFHVPEKDNWQTPSRHQAPGIATYEPNLTNSHRDILTYPINLNQCNINPSFTNYYTEQKSSSSVPSNLQLCGCYLRDIQMNTNYQYVPKFNNFFDPTKVERPRRLKIAEKSKFKLHKSLPVSPVSEECRFSDFAQTQETIMKQEPRRSFSYFIDLDSKSTEEGLRQVCSDIEKFSQELNYDIYEPKKEENTTQSNIVKEDDDDGNFSSDSLEDCSFNSTRNIKKTKKYSMPRRCYSNNEIYNHDNYDDNLIVIDPIPKSKTSFYLNQSNRNSQDSILSDDYQNEHPSYCNSLESVLSDDSECRSAPLEVLFTGHRHKKNQYLQQKPCSASGSPYHQPSTSRNIIQDELYSGSLPNEYFDKNYISYFTTSPKHSIPIVTAISPTPEKQDLSRSKSLGNDMKENIENIENQNPVLKIKKSNTSYDFQQKLLKFETGLINQETPKPLCENAKKSIAYFIETPKSKKNVAYFIESAREKFEKNMDIPTLKTKNIQYKSKYCNVLNNKPEVNKPETLFGDASGVPIKNNPVIIVKESKKSNTLESTKPNNGNSERRLETTSLDRHILNKPLWESEKVVHKPPKAVRRNSSKTYSKNRSKKLQNNFSVIEKSKTPVTFDRNVTKVNKTVDNDSEINSVEDVIEVNYKEKNREVECEANSKIILADIYDSLDKLITDSKMEQDSLENLTTSDENFWGKSRSVLETEQRNVWKKYDNFDKINAEKSSNTSKIFNLSPSDLDKIQNSIENIKLLHEIQQKVHKINLLVDTFKENITKGKVKVLSKMYETLSRSQIGLNNIAEFSTLRKKRNLSLPNFMERNLSVISTINQQLGKNLESHNLKVSKTTNEMPYKRPPEVDRPKKAISKKLGFDILPSKQEGDFWIMRMIVHSFYFSNVM